MIAKVGQKIKWSFDKNAPHFLAKKTFTASVVIIDKKEKHYGVFAEYGMDYIPFNKCIIINNK